MFYELSNLAISYEHWSIISMSVIEAIYLSNNVKRKWVHAMNINVDTIQILSPGAEHACRPTRDD